jgi:3-hydroxyisobutyrate dehydrogenase
VDLHSLPGPPEVEAVALGPDGLISGMQRGAAYFDLSTNAPNLVRRLHAAFAEKGLHLLDAPVSGGPGRQDAQARAVDRRRAGAVRQVEAGARRHRRSGVLRGANRRGLGGQARPQLRRLRHPDRLAEVFTMGVKAGVDPSRCSRRCGRARRAAPHVRRLDRSVPARHVRSAGLRAQLAHKDVSLATAVGREFGVPMRVANLALEELTEALNRGWGGRDSRVAMLLQRSAPACKIAVPPDQVRGVVDKG